MKESLQNIQVKSTSNLDNILIEFKIDSAAHGEFEVKENFQDAAVDSNTIFQMSENSEASKKEGEAAETQKAETAKPEAQKPPKDPKEDEDKEEPVRDLEKANLSKMEPYEVKITNNDCILYSMSIGFQKESISTGLGYEKTLDSMSKDHMKFTYENAKDF